MFVFYKITYNFKSFGFDELLKIHKMLPVTCKSVMCLVKLNLYVTIFYEKYVFEIPELIFRINILTLF